MQICTLIFLDGRLQNPFIKKDWGRFPILAIHRLFHDEQEYLYDDDDDDDDGDDDDNHPDNWVELAHGDLLRSLHCSDHLLLVLQQRIYNNIYIIYNI